MLYSPMKFYGHRYKISRVGTFYVESLQSEIQLLYSFMKYDYEKLISPSFREFYKLFIDVYTGRKNGFTDIANVACSCSEDHICLSFHTFAQKQTLHLHHIWS